MLLQKCRNLRREQDIESPHRYFTDTYFPSVGDIFIEFVPRKVKKPWPWQIYVPKLYLFECDQTWISELRKSFRLYGEKMHILD